MAVTLKDVAEACGVSYSTVSKALKNSHLVKPKTKNLIQQKALEMNYIPNHSARALVSKKSGTIGLIWPSVDRVAVTHLISEINHAIKDLGYVMFVSIDDVAAASKNLLNSVVMVSSFLMKVTQQTYLQKFITMSQSLPMVSIVTSLIRL